MINLEQIRAARALLGLKQQELAEKAGISIGTLNNIERGVQTDPKLSTMRAIQKALEAEGIEFTEAELGCFGIQYKARRNLSKAATLLIIDDKSTDRKLYGAWLSRQADKHYKIIEAEDAKSGYEAFVRHKPDCVILDFMMYGKNGFQLLIEMKKEHASLPPIIFVTAMYTETMKRDALAFGAQACLDKRELTKERLCGVVGEALA